MKRVVTLLFCLLLLLTYIGLAQQTSSETYSTLFIKEDGSLWAWGNNSDGQLGDGTNTNRNSPVNILPGTKWISISSSNNTSFGIKKDGTLWVWGSNTNQLFGIANSTEAQRNTPIQIGTETNWKMVTSNGWLAIALKNDGTLWNWGQNNRGVLGDGTTIAKVVPTKFGTESNWSAITLTGSSAFALKQNGTIWAWGNNSEGVLGNGTTTSNMTPTQIGNSSNWKSIDGGSAHVLGIQQDGSLWAWGSNSSGQLGDGTIVNKYTPTRIGNENTWVSASAGSSSMALKANGSLWVWGSNDFGQLGLGNFNTYNIPTQIGSSVNWKNIYSGNSISIAIKKDKSVFIWGAKDLIGLGLEITKKIPTQIVSNVGWKEVSTHYNYTFGIKLDGTLWAWGNNSTGIFGNNSTVSSNIPLQIGSATNWKSVVLNLGTVTALKTDGTLWTWGLSNWAGTLGNGPNNGSNTITRVGTEANWDKIFGTGGNVFAIKSNGSLWGWGFNASNSIISNNSNPVLSPIQIGSELNWKSIGSGFSFTIGLKTDGTLWGWGDNSEGRLGLNSSISLYTTPQRIGNQSNWSALSSSYESTIALNTLGAVWTWGRNQYGSLAYDPAISRALLLPTQISILNNAKDITCGYYSSGAIKTDGSLWTWGDNSSGELGDGTYLNDYSGKRIGSESNWDKIFTSGSPTTFGLKSDGSLYGWGLNNNGQLGVGEYGYQSTPVELFAAETAKTIIIAGYYTTYEIKSDGTLWAWGLNGNYGNDNRNSKNYAIQIGTDSDWKTLSTSSSGVLAIKRDGSLWGWGNNSYGQLGTGTNSSSFFPVRIGTDNNWEDVSTSTTFSIALKTNGTIWSWGTNNVGQLGNGNNSNNFSPTQIGTDTDWRSISTANSSGFAIKSNGALYSWGLNTPGTLGDGSLVNQNTPIRIGTTNDWKIIKGGSIHVMAIKENGSLWAWGNNQYGQLGNSTTNSSNTPTQIGTDLNWSNIITSSNSNHTLAVKSNGTLWATGRNNYGQLGIGDFKNSTTFKQVGILSNWIDATAGGFHSFAINELGESHSWGNNIFGQLNYGFNTTNSTIRQIGNNDSWKTVSAGTWSSGALRKDGTLWMWGLNSWGQLGDSSYINKGTPTKITNNNDWKSLSIGFYHTHAIKNDGSLWGWGQNTYGQLGEGSTTNYISPIKIGTSNDWKEITSGFGYNIALKTNGTLWSWGLNSFGQLGNNSLINSSVPIQIGNESDWISISSGEGHTLALKSNGTLWAWGKNLYGQIGIGNQTNSLIPIQIGSDSNWAEIFASNASSSAIKRDGTLWSWGNNDTGELGDGTIQNKSIPIQVGITSIKKYGKSNLAGHKIIQKTDGTLWAWGNNYYGQLGDNSTILTDLNGNQTITDKYTPIQISSDTDWKELCLGLQNSLAIRNDGTLWAWGNNEYGQLGDGNGITNIPKSAKPLVEITQSGRSAYCSGGSIILTASEGFSYTWSTGATTRSITVNTSGTYSVTVYYPIGDVVTSDPIIIPASPNTTISTTGSMTVNRFEDLKTYKLTVPASNGITHQWYNNGIAIPGAVTNSFVPKKNGVYTVTAISTLGCVSSSISKTVNFVLADTLKYSTISANGNSSFLIKPNGTLWSWGQNTYGQLGLGDKINRAYAVQIGTSSDWKFIANSSSGYTIAIKKDGSLWSWGLNGSRGLLGIGDASILESTIPIRVGTSNDWDKISVGGNHTIALKTNGTIWAWGQNTYGQLGDSTNVIKLSPKQIGNDSDWIEISAGSTNSYAIKLNGSAYGWGLNSNGQLADGTTVNKYSPNKIGTSNDWGQIKSGNGYTLALKVDGSLWGLGNYLSQFGISNPTNPMQIGSDYNWASVYPSPTSTSLVYALKTNGTLWSTGYNNYGELGLGNTLYPNTLTQVGTNNTWRSVNAGLNHILGLDNNDNLYSWGLNSYGQLGKGKLGYFSIPRKIGDDYDWVKIISGRWFTGGIKKDGSLWMWGLNNNGQLGNGTTTNQDKPIKIGTELNWKNLALGVNHSLAVKTDGSLWAWGSNVSGKLGDGTTTQRLNPVQIGTDTDWNLISVSPNHSAVIKKNGTLWSTGYNLYGQIGDGTNTNRSSFIQIGTSTDWTNISTGFYHILALKSNGTLWAWGRNDVGQLGNGTLTDSNVPIQIGNSNDWIAIHTGSSHSIAIKKDGTIWGWGANYYGQIGITTSSTSSTPVQILDASAFKLPVSQSPNHSLFQKKDGTIWTLGFNGSGQLGNASTSNINTPSLINSDKDWSDFSISTDNSIAIKNDGSLWGWGNSYYGQLGEGNNFFYTPSLAKPIVEISNSGRNTLCQGGSLILTASEGLSYTWSTGATTRSITVNAGGNYNVTVRYPIGDIVTSDVLNIPTSPLPDVAITTTGSTAVVNLTDTKTYALKVPVVTGATYQWSKDGATISGATAAEYVPQENGTYKVNVTSPFGCLATSLDKLVKYELADSDKDGITDNIDKCPNTAAGAIIDAFGCEIFNLPAKNYSVSMGSGTCAGAKNGSIQISFSDKNYDYTIKAVGNSSGYSKDFTYKSGTVAALNIAGLAKDTYNVCITIDGKTGYEQCFDVIISEPEPLKTTSSFDPKSNTIALDLAGSESYSISINGVIEKVNASSYSKVLTTGLNKIIITTDLGCQGKVEEEIFISEQAQAFPNPTSGPISIYVPGVDSSVRVSIHALGKTILDESRELDQTRIVKYDLSKMETGIYIIQVSGPHVNKTLKLIKQ